MIANIAQSVEIIVKSKNKQRLVRKANADRTQQKEQGRTAIYYGPKKNFKSQLRVDQETLEVILGGISQLITKTPTNFISNLMKVHRQVALPSSNII